MTNAPYILNIFLFTSPLLVAFTNYYKTSDDFIFLNKSKCGEDY
jgi:hypothetical protein